MILSARNDRFKFDFPRTFIPEEIKKKYSLKINQMPTPIVDTLDFVNATIQGIDFPEPTWEPANQPYGVDPIYHRSSTNETNWWGDKRLEIKFQFSDAYLNYWILYETMRHWYKFPEYYFHVDPFRIQILDYYDNHMISIVFKDILFTGLDKLSLDWSDNSPEFKTFNAKFTFNEISIEIQTD